MSLFMVGIDRAEMERQGAFSRHRQPALATVIDEPPFVALTSVAPAAAQPSVARSRQLIGVGDVRLHNRTVLASLLPRPCDPTWSDLRLCLALLEDIGIGVMRQVLGEFGFVAWSPTSRTFHLIRDSFGIRPLYWTVSPNGPLASSSASTMSTGRAYDTYYIAELFIGGVNPESRTIFTGISSVPAGSVVTWRDGRVEHHGYWSLEAAGGTPNLSETDAIDGFREHFRQAIVTHHSHDASTWAALSGGLDSSSIVSTTEQLTRAGTLPCALGGTVSCFDDLGRADERLYSDAVVQMYGTPNTQLHMGWPWQHFGDGLPLTDQPISHYTMLRTQQRIEHAIRSGGGRVYLSGLGADHYLAPTLVFLSDLLVAGQWGAFGKEAIAWASLKQQSAWRYALRYGVWPLLPDRVRASSLPKRDDTPDWVDAQFARTTHLGHRSAGVRRLNGRWGQKLFGSVEHGLRHLIQSLHPDPLGDGIETRYPFLYRPLVEYAVSLPYHYRFRADSTKHVLREAMRGVLPEIVRRRSSKASTGTRAWWALRYESEKVTQLMQDPILGELGCVDVRRFQSRARAALRGRGRQFVRILDALTLETWLRVRERRWTSVDQPSSTEVAA